MTRVAFARINRQVRRDASSQCKLWPGDCIERRLLVHTPGRWRAGLRTRNVNLLLPKAPRSCKLRGVQTSPMSIAAPKVLQRRHRGGVQEGLSFFLLQKASGGPRPVWTMYWERHSKRTASLSEVHQVFAGSPQKLFGGLPNIFGEGLSNIFDLSKTFSADFQTFSHLFQTFGVDFQTFSTSAKHFRRTFKHF